jgi:hypothetical protein
MFDEIDNATDSEPIGRVDIVEIGDVLVDRVGFMDVESALVTLKHFSKHKPTNVTPSTAIVHFKRK